ncbi:MAG: S41 family peptidase [Planctomycetaceae bacterium]|nr:S41 family peptidase [Planctomycetaceae bacterium]
MVIAQLLTWVLLVTAVNGAMAAEELLQNRELRDWADGKPAEWQIETGATSGSTRESIVQPLDGGGVELRGDNQTGVWRIVQQRVDIQPGVTYRLGFTAAAKGVRREAKQFNNCYVGVFLADAAGKRKGIEFRTIFEPTAVSGQLVFAAPEAATRADVMLFLSQTGTLRVQELSLTRVEPRDSFRLLVEELGRYYSFLQLKGIDWTMETDAVRVAAESANSPETFVAAVKPLLARLEDLHVSCVLPSGEAIPMYISRADPNFQARAVAQQLEDVNQVGRMGFVGRTAEGYGYAALGTLSVDNQTATRFVEAFEGLLDAPALIVDLRVNGGGTESLAQEIVSRLTDQPVLYARNQVRCGPAPDDLLTISERILSPHATVRYTKPVAVLIGPKCVSSGEGMALMLKTLPHAKLFGQSTRGASGNPRPIGLPNGVAVHYSTWISLTPDDRPIEGIGVVPDVTIDDDPTGEKGLDEAIGWLDGQTRR